VTIKKARTYLTYERDVEILDQFATLADEGVTSTFAIIALRHGKATAPTSWSGPDAARPLTERGVQQSATNVVTIEAWRPRKIITSPAVRCVATVAPLAAATGIKPKQEPNLSQDAWEDGSANVREVVGKRVRKRTSAVLCSHGPVLPEILREVALATGTVPGSYLGSASDLPTGGFSVIHLSATNPSSGIIAIETHAPRV
jgi:8-oxo-dGTP diphosphatase